MDSTLITNSVSWITFLGFLGLQVYYFRDTKKYRKLYHDFFHHNTAYSVHQETAADGRTTYPQLSLVGGQGSDLNDLLKEINVYLYKTKGTSDYEFIRNKVERKLAMRYDQSVVHLSFPTYLGLMGTFLGVFIGISMFLFGFDGTNSVSDASISNLLKGVIVSMITSLFGLGFTTFNTHKAGEARKKIEDDKNEFFDFMQTEAMQTASASLVSAISHLHDTVDKFGPAFDKVINRFQATFDRCTQAFGDSFEKNVRAVSDAVAVMGRNMDKINYNIDLQEKVLKQMKSDSLTRGLEKYIEAADHFASITKSLDMFEQARRMMLAAAQEAIALQHQYNESLRVPREVAVSINTILGRITKFEESINELGEQVKRRDMLGNDVVNLIREQLSAIAKKGKITDRYIQIADGKLSDLYAQQVKVIKEMGERYQKALSTHIEGFETMMREGGEQLQKRHEEFAEALEAKFSIDEVRKEFTKLQRLDDIVLQLQSISKAAVTKAELEKELNAVRNEISKLKAMPDLSGGKAATEKDKHSIWWPW